VALKLDASAAAAELRIAAAMKLYELGRLSSGAAAQLAGISRVAFLVKLAEFGVDTFREPESELADDDLSLKGDAPEPRAIQGPELGRVIELPEVGGLHHRYVREVA
jgi:predicted HTH domain antitoxin